MPLLWPQKNNSGLILWGVVQKHVLGPSNTAFAVRHFNHAHDLGALSRFIPVDFFFCILRRIFSGP